ncbi:MAG TPA: hypothetical protein VGH52_09030 [Gaiellaceae bacterium]|jgi:hypothetical protein
MGREARELGQAKLSVIGDMSWEDLDSYGVRNEDVIAPSGRTYRVKSSVFWDMEPWKSDLYVIVKVYGRWWRKVRPHKLVSVRGGETVPAR